MKRYSSKYKLLLVVSIFSILCILPMQGAFSAPEDLLPFENMTAEVGRGFGDNWNRYAWSMEEFDGHIYVGTWSTNPDYPAIISALLSGEIDLSGSGNILEGISFTQSQGGEIWRHDGGQNWTQVYKADETDTGFRKMVEYDGTLYAATANNQEGTNLYCSTDGTIWDELDGGPMANSDNNSIRTMLVNNGLLYVGTENNVTGGELWSYNGSSWNQIGSSGAFGNDAAVAELAEFGGFLFVGTWDFTDTFSLYKVAEHDSSPIIFDVTPEVRALDGLNNLGVMRLIEYDNELYLGTVNYLDGFSLLRSSTPWITGEESWDVITTNGFDDPDNAYAWSMEVWDDTLYMGTFNTNLLNAFTPEPRAQLLYTQDGNNWETLVDDGFGSSFTYGVRTMMVSDDRLYIGTASNAMVYDPVSLLDYVDYLNHGGNGVDIDPEMLTGILENSGYFHDGNTSWIGMEVYASQQVPEPITVFLLGIGLLGLGRVARKIKI